MVSVSELFRLAWLVAYAETSAGGLVHDIISKSSREEIMLKPYLLDMFDVAVALVPLPLLNTTSGNPSSVISCCMTPKGLLKKRKNLR